MALDLPPRARERFVEWRSRAIGDRDDLRLVSERSLHVTLAFIGRRPERDIEPIADALSTALAGLAPPRLSATKAVGIPRRRPRLFALDLDDRGGRASAVQAAVASALTAPGWYEPEKRPFWPHITFARVTKNARNAPAVDYPPPPPAPFTATRVTLYRSHLSPRGARYEALTQTRLR